MRTWKTLVRMKEASNLGKWEELASVGDRIIPTFLETHWTWRSEYSHNDNIIYISQNYPINSSRNVLRALCKKIFQKNRKTTPTHLVQNRLRIPKLYLACLSDHSWVRNDFLKLTGAPLKSPTFALNSVLQIIGRVLSIGKILFYPSTLKNHCELNTCLTDKPDTVLESSDDSKQDEWGGFSIFFGKFFCTGPLIQQNTEYIRKWVLIIASIESCIRFNLDFVYISEFIVFP